MPSTIVRAGLIGAMVAVVFAVLSRVPCLGAVFACLGFFVGFGVGAYAVQLARAAGRAGNFAQDVMDGAIAAAISSAIGSVFGFVLAVFKVGTEADTVRQFIGGLALQGFGEVFALCFALVFGSIAGAIGGAIYSASNPAPGGTTTP
ncbi:MAG: hypothetical protein HYR71_13820 [Chloroflexi bacterium]|nr:hypothetical protein [Chloroflexota bacterium]